MLLGKSSREPALLESTATASLSEFSSRRVATRLGSKTGGRLSTQKYPASSSAFKAIDLPDPEIPVMSMICTNKYVSMKHGFTVDYHSTRDGCMTLSLSVLTGLNKRMLFVICHGFALPFHEFFHGIETAQLHDSISDSRFQQNGYVSAGSDRNDGFPDG